ncbi:MAG: hypothetical protein ACLFPX_03365 [Candidatus Omnitrophota bacterium]
MKKKAAKKKTVKKQAPTRKKAAVKSVKRSSAKKKQNTPQKTTVKKRPVKRPKVSGKTSAKKKPVRPARKKAVRKKSTASASPGVLVGEVTHYFSKIKVCVLKVTGKSLLINEMIRVVGKQTDFRQTVVSMQVESRDVRVARKGSLVGLKVKKPVKAGDKVYKV